MTATTGARVVVYDWSEEPDTTGNGWIVDLRDVPGYELGDTSSRWFATERAARDFAFDLAALLILPIAER